METINRKFTDSGYLVLTNDSLISNSSWLPILDSRFDPYDDILIVNLNSDNDVEVVVNDKSTQLLPKANQLQLNQLIRTLKLTNIGSTTITSNQIRIFYRNTGYKGKELKAKTITYSNLVMQGLRTLKIF